MLACPVSLDPLSYPLIFHIHCSTPSHPRFVIPFSNYASQSLLNVSFSFLPSQYRPNYHCCSDTDSTLLDIDDDDAYSLSVEGESSNSLSGDGVYIEIKKLERNARRIRSMIAIDASLDTIWDILTDYEKLVDFIPSLAVSKLIEKKNNFARLYQIGQQNLPFGLKFNAKGVLDCYEKDLERFPYTKKRDIEFKMIEGDFQVFEGKWSIEQFNKGKCEEDSLLGQGFQTTLSYLVDVKPKLWLPVRLVEGRLRKDIETNLSCIREEAQKLI
ncbi:LOW QUALITY PROTEIN: Polyketide_cyc domain-containing protein, partial [Cephalotus follicularis]